MTEDEQRQCKSDTLEELAEVRATRRCLVMKAERMQRQLQAGLNVVGEALATEPGQQVPTKGQSPDEKHWPTYADVVAVHREMTKVCNRIHVLTDRMRQCGVID